MDWDDLEAEAKDLQRAQCDIDRELDSHKGDSATPDATRVLEGLLRKQAERLKRFLEALIRLRQ
jgi:hypothetical protein